MITGHWADAAIYPNTNCFLRAADGAISTFNPPGAITSNCLAINNDGVISGFPFNNLVPLSINLAGEITGTYQDSNFANRGFVRTPKGSFTSFAPPTR